jgi:hypothetical protein
MLDQVQADTKARQKSIVDGWEKTADLAKQSGQEFKNAAGSLHWNNKSVVESLKNTLGISAPGVPGTTGTATAGAGISGGAGTGKAGKDTAGSIATGGTKTTNITVNVAQMGNDMKIYVSSVKEGAANMRDMILDEMTRVLSMAQGQAM